MYLRCSCLSFEFVAFTDLQKKPELMVTEVSSDNSLKVQWSDITCSRSDKTYVLQYHLFLCSKVVDSPQNSPDCGKYSFLKVIIAKDLRHRWKKHGKNITLCYLKLSAVMS